MVRLGASDCGGIGSGSVTSGAGCVRVVAQPSSSPSPALDGPLSFRFAPPLYTSVTLLLGIRRYYLMRGGRHELCIERSLCHSRPVLRG